MSRDSSSGGGRVFSFLLAFTVLFVIVFGLGVFVGKRLSQQELTITKRFEEAAPEPSAAPVEEFQETESGLITESPSPVIEEAAVESPPPPVPTAVPPAGDEKKEVEKKSVEKEDDAVKEAKATPVSKRTDAAAPVKPDERLAEITREIERELDKKAAGKKNEPETVKPALPRVDSDGVYTVQIGSFQDQKQANSLASALQSKGYPVFIKSMKSPDNKNWYRVRVGTFGDIEAAKAYGESLRQSEPSVKLVFITVNN